MTEARSRLFGTDLRLAGMAGGLDLVPDGTGELDLAAGDGNIVQALTLRLRVRRGELAPLGWADYGSRLHELIGEPNTPRTAARMMAFARSAIEQDPRVQAVEDIRAVPVPGERDLVRMSLSVLLIDRPNPLNLVVDVDLEGP